MQAVDALSAIIDNSGMTKSAIAASMGRNGSYIRITVNRGYTPRTDIMAEIADACGYDLKLLKRDGTDEITIDPPEPRQ